METVKETEIGFVFGVPSLQQISKKAWDTCPPKILQKQTAVIRLPSFTIQHCIYCRVKPWFPPGDDAHTVMGVIVFTSVSCGKTVPYIRSVKNTLVTYFLYINLRSRSSDALPRDRCRRSNTTGCHCRSGVWSLLSAWTR